MASSFHLALAFDHAPIPTIGASGLDPAVCGSLSWDTMIGSAIVSLVSGSIKLGGRRITLDFDDESCRSPALPTWARATAPAQPALAVAHRTSAPSEMLPIGWPGSSIPASP